MNTARNIWKTETGFIWMLAIAVLSMISTQFTEGILWQSKFILRAGFFLFMLIAVRSSSVSSLGKSIGYTIATSILLLAIVMIRKETQWLNLVYTILVAGYMIYIITLVVTQIFAERIITINKIAGGVAAYVLIGLIWASLYLTVFILQPESFAYGGQKIESNEALKQLSYFSFVTLTTLGYGDVTATGSLARVLVMLEGLLGQLFPAIFIAKLVSQQIEDSKKK